MVQNEFPIHIHLDCEHKGCDNRQRVLYKVTEKKTWKCRKCLESNMIPRFIDDDILDLLQTQTIKLQEECRHVAI